METNVREKALFEMLRQAEPELREKYGDDSAVQILDEILYPIAEKLIEKDAVSSEDATANTPTVEATQIKTDMGQLEQMLATPIEEMVNADVLQMIAEALDTCIDELDECATDEERLSTLGHAFESMVVLGRWSVMQ
ncbi:MAG TPA: hypothetical protein VE616_10140 [Candidatus Udaeobacter sp.]|nr:hypothetical protein [Candidatus Udaeobacter sp.]